MLPEITNFAGPLALVAVGLLLAVLATTLTGHLPIPAPALFLVGAALVSAVAPSVRRDVGIITVERVAVVALIVILFNGGRDIGARTLRRSVGDVSALGLLGTFLTAAGLALTARIIVGFPWAVAGVLGAALAATDPAVMFSVLGRREVGGRSGTVLEGEAGINDPAGIALLLGMVQVATHPGSTILIVLKDFVFEMSIGILIGLIGGRMLIALLHRIRLGDSGLYPVLALAWAGALYGATTLAGGSGFGAVFVAGLLLGDERLPYAGEIDRFTASLASLAEVAVFLALGLTIELSGITATEWVQGLGLFLVMAIIIRPLVVTVTLVRSGLGRREKAFIAWSGLKGAVPILLGAFAALSHVSQHARIYDLIFVVVLASVVVQGGLVPTVAARLAIPMQLAPDLPWELSVKLAEPPRDRVQHVVAGRSAADGASLAQLPFGAEGWVTLVLRDDQAFAPRPDLILRAGDVVFLLGAGDPAALAAAFARPGQPAVDRAADALAAEADFPD
jgi:cell volume regulation protein A